MLYLALFLHFYQPPTQFPQITKKIAQESYEKILKIIYYHLGGRLTINISASLTEQLEALGFEKIIDGFRQLAEEGRVELVSSAAYHPLLPKIPKEEIERQIKLNDEINRKYFGKIYKPRGFFPPEMAYSPEVGEVVEKLGYKWIILDESAIKTKDTSDGVRMHSSEVDGKQMIYLKKNSDLAVFIRNTELSLAIAFSKIRTVKELLDRLLPFSRFHFPSSSFVILAMDGETFGHHQPPQLKFLEELLKTVDVDKSRHMPRFGKRLELVTISELLSLFPKRVEIEPRTSTWGESWKRWDDPKNPIHRLQWKLYKLALRAVEAGGDEFFHPTLSLPASESSHSTEVSVSSGAAVRVGMSKIVARRPLSSRQLLDRALHSDQFWWASHDPCWHPKMVERGAKMLKEVVLLSEVGKEEKEEAEKLYNKIILTGRELYGEEIIPC